MENLITSSFNRTTPPDAAEGDKGTAPSFLEPIAISEERLMANSVSSVAKALKTVGLAGVRGEGKGKKGKKAALVADPDDEQAKAVEFMECVPKDTFVFVWVVVSLHFISQKTHGFCNQKRNGCHQF